jgi:hypothetical protein
VLCGRSCRSPALPWDGPGLAPLPGAGFLFHRDAPGGAGSYCPSAGVSALRPTGEHGHSEHDLYYVRRWHLTRELAEALAIQIANATFAARQQSIWGEGSSAAASDSTHFGAWDQNIFTEWHSRYGTRRADLLARRAQVGGGPLPAAELHGLLHVTASGLDSDCYRE